MISPFSLAVNLLYPRRCPICDEPVKVSEGDICTECYSKLKIITGSVCFICGKPLINNEQECCADCLKRKHKFTFGRALYAYESIQTSIYKFKYSNRQEYAEFFGKEMAMHFAAFVKLTKAEALIPVPISRSRRKKRGYNQAELLADVMGKQLNLPVYRNLVKRVKNTLPQKELNAYERQKNLKKAFKLAQNDVKLNSIIVMDDIYTTGSTIDALAGVLLTSGVQKVYFLTLSLTTGI